MKIQPKGTFLKPCPFCGGEAYISSAILGTDYITANHTKKCHMKPDTWLISAKSMKKQIKAWNRRPED